VDCLDLGHESRAALSGQPINGRRRSLAAQPRVCQAVRLHNTATSQNLTLDPLYQYMRPFELARTVNVRSSFWDSTTAHYIDLPYTASLWMPGRIIASPAEPCSTVWVVAQMTMLKYWSLVWDTVTLPAAVGHGLHQVCALYIYMYIYTYREIMLFIGKPKERSRMISNTTNPLKESRKESLLRCAGSTSICVWLVCDLVVMCVQAVGDRALGDLCVCVRCGSVQSQKV